MTIPFEPGYRLRAMFHPDRYRIVELRNERVSEELAAVGLDQKNVTNGIGAG